MRYRGQELSAKAYPLGDKYPNRQPKTGDAANFGLFKNNCKIRSSSLSMRLSADFKLVGGAIRRHCSEFKGQRQNQWRNGAILKYASIHSMHHVANQNADHIDLCDIRIFSLVLISP